MPSEILKGTVTLVFTDIEGSSELWERCGPAFQPVLEEHNRVLRERAADWHGVEVKAEGDSFFFVFGTSADAVRFAVDSQRALVEHDWPADVGAVRVRIGIHTGEPLIGYHPSGAADYYGPVVNRAARVMSAGHGGQIVVSDAAYEVARLNLPPEISFHSLGVHRLQGVGEETLWQVCHPELPSDFPPLTTLDPHRHKLPVPPTAFIGREAETASWYELLHQPATRLMTLVGLGGIGKTRAALQLAELSTDRFRDGVVWVDLQECRTGDGMLQRIAYQLGIQIRPQPPIEEQIETFLRDRQLLLVLDNTEQIPEAAQVVGRLLAAAPGFKCLVTARRGLGLRAEHLVEVPPLPASDAEALFAECARARQANFDLTPSNAADIAELCRRLEDVPLAIELAASRIVGMTPREMLSRLSERFRLLQTRDPDLPPRQRALRGAIDWSYELLTDEDKSLFAQIAVFRGGFALEDAEAVCEVSDVLEGLMELRRQSLLRAETDAPTQQTRFFMLETVREYAMGRWEGGDARALEALRQRHADHFLGFAEERAGLMRTRDEVRALDELGSEIENLRAAVQWSAETRQGELCTRLVIAFYQLLYRRGFWSEAKRCLETGWEATGWLEDNACARRAAIGYCLASLALDMGDLAEARRQAQTSLDLRRELGDDQGIADSLNLLGLAAMAERDSSTAERCFEDALRLLGDHTRRGVILHNLALLAVRRGDVEEGRRLYQQSLTHDRAVGDVRGEAETLGNLGALAHNAGEYTEARQRYHESLALYRVLRDPYGIAVMLNNLGELAEIEGKLDVAIALFGHAGSIFRDLRAADEHIPTESLERLAGLLGPERFAELRRAGEETAWEEIV